MAKKGNVVNEIDHGDVRAVKATWPDVISPTQVRIRDIVQVSAARAAIGRIFRTRKRVERSKLKVSPYL